MRLNVRTHYPVSSEFEYETVLERINLDDERINDIYNNNGFIITSSKPIKDDIKDINGIFSQRYGQTLQDKEPFGNRYRCKCGLTTKRINEGEICPVCGTPVVFMDDNFEYFGWMPLHDPYHIIHPNLFMTLTFFIGEKAFNNIIKPDMKKDEDGKPIPIKRPKDEPFYGIGMMEFYDRFDEIISHYAKKNPNKKEYLNDIIQNRDKIFTQSIPVYTIHLRPFRAENHTFHFEGTNARFAIMNRLVHMINNDKLKITSKGKTKNEFLHDLQMEYMKLYDEIGQIMKGKKGSLRSLFGGRYNFTARSVITPDPNLNIDEVELSYYALAGLLQQVIINILHKTYHMRYNDAYKLWATSMHEPNPTIMTIIEGIIKNHKRGIPIIINRNPTIAMGGILQMYCVGICKSSYTMSMPLMILKGLAADFDGDTLNILLIINKEFEEAAASVLNPRNSMYISLNDGMFNNVYNHQKDPLINCNTLLQLGRSNYTEEQLEMIRLAKES